MIKCDETKDGYLFSLREVPLAMGVYEDDAFWPKAPFDFSKKLLKEDESRERLLELKALFGEI